MQAYAPAFYLRQLIRDRHYSANPLRISRGLRSLYFNKDEGGTCKECGEKGVDMKSGARHLLLMHPKRYEDWMVVSDKQARFVRSRLAAIL